MTSRMSCHEVAFCLSVQTLQRCTWPPFDIMCFLAYLQAWMSRWTLQEEHI